MSTGHDLPKLSDPLKWFELPEPLVKSAVRACRGFNTMLDAVFYDVPTLTSGLRDKDKTAGAVALVARDRAVDQELVDRAPGVVVARARHAGQRRARDDLAPEEAVEIVGARARRGAREHAVDDVEVVPAVAVEVERVRGPGPATHFDAFECADAVDDLTHLRLQRR